jgi:hypothetical protein
LKILRFDTWFFGCSPATVLRAVKCGEVDLRPLIYASSRFENVRSIKEFEWRKKTSNLKKIAETIYKHIWKSHNSLTK